MVLISNLSYNNYLSNNLQEGTGEVLDNMNDTETHQNCAELGELLSLIGNKWTVQVVGVLSKGSKRFNQIRKDTGASQRMLTQTLRKLEEEGLVTRTVFPSTPPRVDYELTHVGCTLIDPLKRLIEWSISHKNR